VISVLLAHLHAALRCAGAWAKGIWKMTSRAFSEEIKVGIAAAGLLAVIGAAVMERKAERRRLREGKNEAEREFLKRAMVLELGPLKMNARNALLTMLLLICLFGTINYHRYMVATVTDGYDEYDLIHYYMNAKYYDELGARNLLPAIINADHEKGEFCRGRAPIFLYDNGESYEKRPYDFGLTLGPEVKARFTPQRWKQFVHDFTYIQRVSKRLPCQLWRQLLQDHGFNGTPSWVFVARPIASIVPVEHIKLCTLLDLVWIVAALAAVSWAFGRETFFFAWTFICICYSFRWPHITWAFLRYDWFSSMVIGVCMIKKRKPVAGGAFFGYAALMRYFPGLWMLGIFAKAVHALLRNRDVPLTRAWARIPTRHYKMALGFFAVIAVLFTLSVSRDGIKAHVDSLADMALHVEPQHLSSMRQGLLVVATYRGETEQNLIGTKRAVAVELEKPVRAVALALCLVFCLLIVRVSDWEAVGLAVMPYFWLTTSSYYYYALRMTAVIIHAADLSKPRNIFGLVMLFAIEIFSNWSEAIGMVGNRYFLISWMGIGLAVYSFGMLAFIGREWWKNRGKPISLAEDPEAEAAGGAGG
jgi:hypothetical protein